MATNNDHPGLPFVQARYYTRGRPDGPPLWIVWHDMEASETSLRAENTAEYFRTMTDGRTVSAHYCADDNSVVQCVDLDDVAWTVGNRPGNYRGINIELSGFARQTRAEWLDPFGRAMFAELAPIVASDMRRFGIPNRWCTVDDLKARRAGHTTHNDLRLAFGGTTHTDPGAGFPRDHVIEIVAAELEGEDMPTLAEYAGAVWAHQFADYVDADGDGTRPNITCGDALFKARAESYHAHVDTTELVARSPVEIDPAELVAAMAASEEFMLALGAAIAAALPGNTGHGSFTVTMGGD